jgi:hypothetical protein
MKSIRSTSRADNPSSKIRVSQLTRLRAIAQHDLIGRWDVQEVIAYRVGRSLQLPQSVLGQDEDESAAAESTPKGKTVRRKLDILTAANDRRINVDVKSFHPGLSFPGVAPWAPPARPIIAGCATVSERFITQSPRRRLWKTHDLPEEP